MCNAIITGYSQFTTDQAFSKFQASVVLLDLLVLGGTTTYHVYTTNAGKPPVMSHWLFLFKFAGWSTQYFVQLSWAHYSCIATGLT